MSCWLCLVKRGSKMSCCLVWLGSVTDELMVCLVWRGLKMWIGLTSGMVRLISGIPSSFCLIYMVSRTTSHSCTVPRGVITVEYVDFDLLRFEGMQKI